MKYFLITFLMIMFYLSGWSQVLYTLDEAIDQALINNFDIRVARNQSLTGQINNTAGNAGMLPTVSAVGSGGYQINNVHQELASGTVNNNSSQSTTSLNAGVELSWTLFDGGRMFIAKQSLARMQELGEIKYREQVLQLMYNVVAAYYNVVKQKQQLKSIETIEGYNLERLKITQTGFENGSKPKTDLIQAKIDLNVTKENIINQKFVIESAKKELNLVLGFDAMNALEVVDSIILDYNPDKNQLLAKVDSLNPSVLFYKKQTDIARLDIKDYKRMYIPTLKFTAGYYLTHIENSDGTVLVNRSIGPEIGGSLRIPLYQAGETKRKISLSKIALESAEYNLSQAKLEVNTDIQNAFTNFENNRELMQIEKENYQLTKENLEICMQRLKLGQSTSLEVHLAQESFAQSATRLIGFQYNLKLSETRLKQLLSAF
jgi:outer membrane protein